jgi:CHAD domain-containing protein
VEAVLLAGRLRAVVAEAPAARLTLRGPAGPVLALVAELAAALPALPPRAALAEEGRALARAEAPRARRAGPPVPEPGMGVEQALVVAIGHLAEAMLWHAPVARAGRAPEGVHQMRVALRRLRSLLKVFRPAADAPALRALDRDLRALADVLGPARDWDVFLGGLGAELAAALPDEPRMAGLLRAARERRDAAYAGLRAVLDGAGYRRLLWEAVAVVETRPWRGDGDEEAAARRALPLEEFAARLLGRRWQRLAGAGEDVSALPDEALHELRLEAKRLRYPAELFAPLWGRKRARRFLKRLAEVQEAFGLANDVAVARGLVGQLAGRGGPGPAWAVGVAEGWALARARRVRTRSAEAWEALLAADPYWEAG